MTNEEAIEILTKHNAWRRGDDTHEMGCVKQLGLAIDRAIEVLRGDTWQPIESAPRDKHEVFLVCSKKLYPPYVVVNASDDCPLKASYPWRTYLGGNYIGDPIYSGKITHWRPLPKPPQNGERNGK